MGRKTKVSITALVGTFSLAAIARLIGRQARGSREGSSVRDHDASFAHALRSSLLEWLSHDFLDGACVSHVQILRSTVVHNGCGRLERHGDARLSSTASEPAPKHQHNGTTPEEGIMMDAKSLHELRY
jgi:hypothetical protein